jgi:hypothetical protein
VLLQALDGNYKISCRSYHDLNEACSDERRAALTIRGHTAVIAQFIERLLSESRAAPTFRVNENNILLPHNRSDGRAQN